VSKGEETRQLLKKTIVGILIVGLLLQKASLAFVVQPARANSVNSEHHISVPYWGQTDTYYCGPACLQMVFDYYGEAIPQREIAEVARTASAAGGTYTDDLRRAAHFSNMSTSMGSEMPENITGYSLRKLGYSAFEWNGMTIDQLKALIDQDYPIIALMYTVPEGFGHFRVVIGYDDTYIYTNDPWHFGGGYGGPNYRLNYTQFNELWDYSGHQVMLACPWQITLDMPSQVSVGGNFTVTADITYPCPVPFPPNYPASSCKATITLPTGLKLSSGETSTKSLEDLQAGSETQVSWSVSAEATGHSLINVEAEGNIAGFVAAKPSVGPAYAYQDRIGGNNSRTILALGPEEHNVAINKVKLGKNIIAEGYGLVANITVRNSGSYVETFNVDLYANATIIYTRSLTLAEYTTLDLDLNISTSGFAHGNYTVSVYAEPVPNETSTTDNILIGGWVLVSIPCDLAPQFGIVDIFDIATIAIAYGSKPGDQNWNIFADVYEDNIIDDIDMFIARSHFGQTG
jgi:uncharacterized protein YvpB